MGCGPTRGAARPVVGGHWDPRAGSSCLASAKMLAPLGGRTVGAPGAQDAVRSGCPLWTRCPAGAWGLSSAAVVPDRGRGARLTIRTKDHRECIVLSSAGRLAPTYGLLRACAGQHPSKPAQPLGPMLYRRQQSQCLHRRGSQANGLLRCPSAHGEGRCAADGLRSEAGAPGWPPQCSGARACGCRLGRSVQRPAAPGGPGAVRSVRPAVAVS